MFGLFSKNKRSKEGGKLPYKTEVHCHILPGIDDGSRCVEESVELVKVLKKMGVERIIATPHTTEQSFENTPQSINAAYQTLLNDPQYREIDGIDLTYSSEYRLDSLFRTYKEKGLLTPYPNNYILIENSFLQPYADIKEMIFSLIMDGYSPILAHPERYSYYHNNRNFYKELHNGNCLFQINILSFAGYYGSQTKDVAMWMLKNDLVDLIGTDLHNTQQATHINTFLQSKEYARLLKKLNIKNDLLF